VQGVAAAAMTPQLLATFRTIFSGRERLSSPAPPPIRPWPAGTAGRKAGP